VTAAIFSRGWILPDHHISTFWSTSPDFAPRTIIRNTGRWSFQHREQHREEESPSSPPRHDSDRAKATTYRTCCGTQAVCVRVRYSKSMAHTRSTHMFHSWLSQSRPHHHSNWYLRLRTPCSSESEDLHESVNVLALAQCKSTQHMRRDTRLGAMIQA
jgi:hypothetical protein